MAHDPNSFVRAEILSLRMSRDMETSRRWRVTTAALATAYVVLVMTADTLALHRAEWLGVDWSVLRWRGASGVDWFKFAAWFVVPVVLALPRMDWGAWGVTRWRRMDGAILAGLAMLGMAAVALTRLVPALEALYPSYAGYPAEWRADYAQRQLVWIASWLLGWEFLFRYFLLVPLRRLHPAWALALCPLIEAGYHLAQKPTAWLEALGMAVFALVLCAWALRRRNALLPLLAHALIEFELLAFQLFA